MGITEKRYGYRANPQLSAAQIAAYLLASPTRRKSIIRDARFPKRSIVAQYSKAREGLVSFLGDGTRSLHHLVDTTDYLEKRGNRADASDWLKRDSRMSIEAVAAFQRAYNKLGFRLLDCRETPARLPALDEWAAKISVDIDVTIHVPTETGKDRIGAAILLFSRGESSEAKRIEQSKTIASLIFRFCNRFMLDRGDPDKKLCLAVDVFTGSSQGPQGQRKLDHIRDACEEIAARWDTINPPEDYDGPSPG
ncbi:hypothetical protein RZS28_05435 [Methylocapsa polymorpha]|uniref:Uncharacterized protein n=1 Tax=Methylocapsa polymorpha TaxID=3080828 RepID=A0ABZ0HU41_9HYPH|nr:hypothetical protein RZS28_05435 [Methylocapsa sp. RX1]